MSESSESSNIEWKQETESGKKTHASRRLDMKKLALADKKSPNKLDSGINRIKNTAPNLKKIRSKIRDVFDEDEDEEYENPAFVFNFEQENGTSSLVDGLKEDEKRKMQVDKELKDQSMQISIGKMEAVLQANKQLQESGLKKIDKRIVNDNMLDITTDRQTFANNVKQQIEKKEKISTQKVANYQDSKDLINGLKKIKSLGLTAKELDKQRIEKLEARDLVELGKEENERKAAQTILKKTGREDKKAKQMSKQDQIDLQNKIKENLRQQKTSKSFERD